MDPAVKAMFKGKLRDEGNRVCADCAERNATWASVSHGTFVCLDCSGIHRSLGVHISFVQSVTLDTWKSEQHVAKMRHASNDAFNQFLQHRGVPRDVILGEPGTANPQRLQQKYHSNAAMLWRERLSALASDIEWVEPPAVPYKDLSPPTQLPGRRSGSSPASARGGSPASRSSTPSGASGGFLKSLRGAASRAVGPSSTAPEHRPRTPEQQPTRPVAPRAQPSAQQHVAQQPRMGVWAALERAEQQERDQSGLVDLDGTWQVEGANGEQETFVLKRTGPSTYVGHGNEGREEDQFALLDARVVRGAAALRFTCRQQYLDRSTSDWEADVVIQAGGHVTLQRGQWSDARGPFGTFTGRLVHRDVPTVSPAAQQVLCTPPRRASSWPAMESASTAAGGQYDHGTYGGISLEEAVGDNFEAGLGPAAVGEPGASDAGASRQESTGMLSDAHDSVEAEAEEQTLPESEEPQRNLEREFYKLRKLPANKRCPNCAAEDKYGFKSACIKFNTFICHHCKAGHQAISHRVKDVGMSTFVPEELDRLAQYGNSAATQTWLGRLSREQICEMCPRKDDRPSVWHAWIERIYVHKEFWLEPSRTSSSLTTPARGTGGGSETAPSGTPPRRAVDSPLSQVKQQRRSPRRDGRGQLALRAGMQRLDLSNSGITPQEVKRLASWLGTAGASSLVALSLRGNDNVAAAASHGACPWALFCDAVAVSPVLQDIDLAKVGMNENGAALFAQAIRRASSQGVASRCKAISVIGNSFGRTGSETIVNLFDCLPALEFFCGIKVGSAVVDWSCQKLGPNDIMLLACILQGGQHARPFADIRQIDLSYNYVFGATTAAGADGSTVLVHTVDKQCGGWAALCSQLIDNMIQEVIAVDIGMGPAGAAVLAQVLQQKEMVRNTKIASRVAQSNLEVRRTTMRTLKKGATVKYKHQEATIIYDHGDGFFDLTWEIVVPSCRNALRVLKIGDNSIGEAKGANLAQWSTFCDAMQSCKLQDLSLRNVGIGAQGLLAFCKLLETDTPFRSAIHILDLSKNNISNYGEGAGMYGKDDDTALARVARSLVHTSIARLNLGGCEIGAAALNSLISSIEWPNTAILALDLKGNPGLAEITGRRLAERTGHVLSRADKKFHVLLITAESGVKTAEQITTWLTERGHRVACSTQLDVDVQSPSELVHDALAVVILLSDGLLVEPQSMAFVEAAASSPEKVYVLQQPFSSSDPTGAHFYATELSRATERIQWLLRGCQPILCPTSLNQSSSARQLRETDVVLQKIIRRVNTHGGGGPTELFTRSPPVRDDAEEEPHKGTRTLGPETPTSGQPTPTSNAPLGWEVATSRSTGQLYYINTATRESQYDFPTGIPPLPLGWSIELSRSTGKIYFVDSTTGIGQYHHPLSTPQSENTSPSEESGTPQPSFSNEEETVEVTFESDGPLGIGWKFDSENDDLILGQVGPGTPASQHSQLVPGLILAKVGDTSISALRVASATNSGIMKLLKERPVTLTLKVPRSLALSKNMPSEEQSQIDSLTAQLAERDEKIKRLEAQRDLERTEVERLAAAVKHAEGQGNTDRDAQTQLITEKDLQIAALQKLATASKSSADELIQTTKKLSQDLRSQEAETIEAIARADASQGGLEELMLTTTQLSEELLRSQAEAAARDACAAGLSAKLIRAEEHRVQDSTDAAVELITQQVVGRAATSAAGKLVERRFLQQMSTKDKEIEKLTQSVAALQKLATASKSSADELIQTTKKLSQDLRSQEAETIEAIARADASQGGLEELMLTTTQLSEELLRSQAEAAACDACAAGLSAKLIRAEEHRVQDSTDAAVELITQQVVGRAATSAAGKLVERRFLQQMSTKDKEIEKLTQSLGHLARADAPGSAVVETAAKEDADIATHLLKHMSATDEEVEKLTQSLAHLSARADAPGSAVVETAAKEDADIATHLLKHMSATNEEVEKLTQSLAQFSLREAEDARDQLAAREAAASKLAADMSCNVSQLKLLLRQAQDRERDTRCKLKATNTRLQDLSELVKQLSITAPPAAESLREQQQRLRIDTANARLRDLTEFVQHLHKSAESHQDQMQQYYLRVDTANSRLQDATELIQHLRNLEFSRDAWTDEEGDQAASASDAAVTNAHAQVEATLSVAKAIRTDLANRIAAQQSDAFDESSTGILVSFTQEGPLGINLTPFGGENGGGVMILRIQHDSQAAEHEGLRTGLVVKAVNGKSMTGLSYQQVTDAISGCPSRPLTVLFSSTGTTDHGRKHPQQSRHICDVLADLASNRAEILQACEQVSSSGRIADRGDNRPESHRQQAACGSDGTSDSSRIAELEACVATSASSVEELVSISIELTKQLHAAQAAAAMDAESHQDQMQQYYLRVDTANSRLQDATELIQHLRNLEFSRDEHDMAVLAKLREFSSCLKDMGLLVKQLRSGQQMQGTRAQEAHESDETPAAWTDEEGDQAASASDAAVTNAHAQVEATLSVAKAIRTDLANRIAAQQSDAFDESSTGILVSFTQEGPLGINLTPFGGENGGGVMILRIQHDSQAAEHEGLRTGLVVKAVNGKSMTGLSYQQVTDAISGCPSRPLTVLFSSTGTTDHGRKHPQQSRHICDVLADLASNRAEILQACEQVSSSGRIADRGDNRPESHRQQAACGSDGTSDSSRIAELEACVATSASSVEELVSISIELTKQLHAAQAAAAMDAESKQLQWVEGEEAAVSKAVPVYSSSPSIKASTTKEKDAEAATAPASTTVSTLPSALKTKQTPKKKSGLSVEIPASTLAPAPLSYSSSSSLGASSDSAGEIVPWIVQMQQLEQSIAMERTSTDTEARKAAQDVVNGRNVVQGAVTAAPKKMKKMSTAKSPPQSNALTPAAAAAQSI